MMLSDVEKSALDLTAPFALYTNRVRLGLFEKLNLLERETVGLFRKKLVTMAADKEFYMAQNNNLDDFQQILAHEKKQLEANVATMASELRDTKQQWQRDKLARDILLKDTIKDYEARLADMAKDADELHDVFVKELEIKDEILNHSNSIKNNFIQKTKELTLKLKTPRLHVEFLEERGKLDEFVAAKLTGEEATAKWLLLDTAKDELSTIAKELKRKEE